MKDLKLTGVRPDGARTVVAVGGIRIGEGFTVIKNDDGRDATSDRAEGFTTQSRDISKDLLIAGGYCTNDADCQIFYDSWGCNGHHSWEATFQRNY